MQALLRGRRTLSHGTRRRPPSQKLLFDDEAWPAPYLLIYSSYVFADDPEGEYHCTHEDEVYGKQGEYTLNLRANNQTADDEEEGECEADQGDDNTQHAYKLDGQQGESRHQVEVEMQETEEAVLCHALLARLMPHLYLNNFSCKGGSQRGYKAGRLPTHVHGVNNVSVVRPEHAYPIAQLHADQPGRDLVDYIRGQCPEDGILPLLAVRPDHFKAFINLRH